jgi:DNA-binding transcriptional LysR family regulator
MTLGELSQLLYVTDFIAIVPYHPAVLTDWMARFASLPLTFQTGPLLVSVLYRPLGARRDATRAFIDTIKRVIREAGRTRLAAANGAQFAGTL